MTVLVAIRSLGSHGDETRTPCSGEVKEVGIVLKIMFKGPVSLVDSLGCHP